MRLNSSHRKLVNILPSEVGVQYDLDILRYNCRYRSYDDEIYAITAVQRLRDNSRYTGLAGPYDHNIASAKLGLGV
ncbi:hypothetical protein GCM10023322_75540 [Rugosimonospora acidiphila]|uniref:Uncharacterized protein n=1 Tax=Rugosimonospora acidiphila TaxID=556531 RepID=A0ABP9SNC0_9ACTN